MLKYPKSVLVSITRQIVFNGTECGYVSLKCPKCKEVMTVDYVCGQTKDKLIPKYCCYCGRRYTRWAKLD